MEGNINIAFVVMDKGAQAAAGTEGGATHMKELLHDHIDGPYDEMKANLHLDDARMQTMWARFLGPEDRDFPDTNAKIRQIQQKLYKLVEGATRAPDEEGTSRFLGLTGNEKVEEQIRDCVMDLEPAMYINILKDAFAELLLCCENYEAKETDD